MESVKNTSGVVKSVRSAAPQVTLTDRRWMSRPTHPRLVSLSWAGVRTMGTHR